MGLLKKSNPTPEIQVLIDMILAEGFDYALNNFFNHDDISKEDAILAAKINVYLTARNIVLEYFSNVYKEDLDG